MTELNHSPEHAITKPKSVPFGAAAQADLAEIEAVLQSLPTAQRDRVKAVTRRTKGRANSAEMKLGMVGEAIAVSYEHSNPKAATLLLMTDLGTLDIGFFLGVTGQVARIGAQGSKVDEANSNFLLSVVRAVQPRDELETLLAVQMGAIHSATMVMARRVNLVNSLAQQEAAERALNKLARTYAMQMEALKRYRTGGTQKVTVEHVTVNAGGQAIVGSVNRGEGVNEK